MCSRFRGLQGTVRWFILFTSPQECFLVMLALLSATPLLAATLEHHLVLPWPRLRCLPPFAALWLACLTFALGVLRRRGLGSSCASCAAAKGYCMAL